MVSLNEVINGKKPIEGVAIQNSVHLPSYSQILLPSYAGKYG